MRDAGIKNALLSSGLLALAACWSAACGGTAGADENQRGEVTVNPVKSEPAKGAGVIELTPPDLDGGETLNAVLERRRSMRSFDPRPLSVEEISQLLWAAQGVTSERGGLRTAPSAGATFPLELHLVVPEGVFRYLPGKHRVERLDDEDRRGELAAASLGQRFVAAAPAVFVIGGVVAKTAGRYGERAELYVAQESGAAAQNLLLQAEALGLAAVWVGAFDDARVTRLARLPRGATPYAVIPVGAHAESR